MPGPIQRKPSWLKVPLRGTPRYAKVREALAEGGLHTVCEEAACPNRCECWSAGTATFLILGDVCTRGCAFCNVGRGDPCGEVDPKEPERLAEAVARLELDYAVITSVTRDDLPDGGAAQFAACVREVKALVRAPLVELLIPDFEGENLKTVLEAQPEVLAHNIEVVRELSATMRHRRFDFDRSLGVLRQAKEMGTPGLLTKSSIMVGLGETIEQLESAMSELREADVDILVLGQYLRPTRSHAKVVEYIAPERFAQLEQRGLSMGFSFVASSPLARTSYRAAEAFAKRRALQGPR
jgi:lipoic acid synthetase